MISITVDTHTIKAEEGTSVLQAALDAGIYIPHICSHNSLKPSGACRLCIVEIAGYENIVTSCSTIAQNGMKVITRSEKLVKLRRLAAELMLTAHPSECTSCPKYLNCELQSLIQYLEVTDQRIRKRLNLMPTNTSNPLIVHNYQRCILCGRCVRVCQELRGVEAITFVRKKGHLVVGTPNGESLVEAGCKFCGSCIEVCPTGSILDQRALLLDDTGEKDRVVPCRAVCPAGTDVPRYTRFIREGKYAAAVAVIREKAPFPNTLGHICNHICESVCRRNEINGPVSIKELKRFAATFDHKNWKTKLYRKPDTGKTVAVIGSGPAGLTAAYYLAKQGHAVTIFEALSDPGGMMRVGIPNYRLPLTVIDDEIAEIKRIGVIIKTNCRIQSATDLLNQGFNAVLVAIGAHKGLRLPIPGAEVEGILLNTSFLRAANQGKKVKIGKTVLVLGGGNVALDCAGVAKRLGAEKVQIACLEARNAMTSSPEEIDQALAEGTIFYPAVSFDRFLSKEGHVTGIECSRLKEFYFDEAGRPVLDIEEGSEHMIHADTVIFAVGQIPDLDQHFGLAFGRGNRIQVTESRLETSVTGIFAAGDVTTGTASVIQAIAGGRKATISIDRYLGGDGNIEEKLAPEIEPDPWLGKDKTFLERERTHTTYLPVEERIQNFDLISCGFNEDMALREASRCLQCDLRLQLEKEKFWGEYPYR